ncbi:S-adenosyl-L-methionine-dependent methyltransferase [Aspergillus pseudodeflectus]|uniref:DNA (cytosine-5-)-methyltransferase n=1 Tax=Aspergillus pseudodeflectus TaxID=176178 RepID=A0ABR4JXD7_9EURO
MDGHYHSVNNPRPYHCDNSHYHSIDGGCHSVEEYESDASSVTIDSLSIDNDPDRLYFLRENSRTIAPFSSFPPGAREIIDLTGEENLHEGDYVTDECFEVLREDWLRSVKAKSPDQIVPPTRTRLEDVCSVELLLDNTFLRISSIWRESDGQITLGGRRLLKAKNHAGTYIPQGSVWKNELVWVENETSEVALDFVKKFIPLHFTNYCHVSNDHEKARRPAHLFCRLKEILNCRSGATSVEYLSYGEADPGYRVEPTILRQLWRGPTAAFGTEKAPQTPIVVLDDIENEQQPDLIEGQRRSGKYTFGDAFCGAGGVSCGAEAAGLEATWAFDISSHAAQSYRLNFPKADCWTSDIFNFLTNNEGYLRVDVTHGSPPCQTFSPAHTIESANDDANSACIFSCGNLIRKAKPRVHTMEETSGLFERHKETFYGVIHDFIEIGYSVRWALLNCMEYGVPQSRKRLIIIAAGPGETLPQMPKPTHGIPGSGLRDLATINQMISNIPPGTPDHDIEGARIRSAQKHRPPFDANQQVRTITCGGGENNYHPSGTRCFTNREFACLQTFPLSFRFGPREVRKQIGNAVPPLLAKGIYGEIIRSLQQTDEQEMRESTRALDP